MKQQLSARWLWVRADEPASTPYNGYEADQYLGTEPGILSAEHCDTNTTSARTHNIKEVILFGTSDLGFAAEKSSL